MSVREKLIELLNRWEQWAATANRDEDGWQSTFGDWESLMSVAAQLMQQSSLTPEELQLIETCWAISEEDETLADFAKLNLTACLVTLERLAHSVRPEVRWQIYEVYGQAGSVGEKVLRLGMKDPNSYCRRRALLAFAKVFPDKASVIAESFVMDADPYVRKAAVSIRDGSTKQ
jgi:hypothetical protein